jgi:hypothetical protein
MVPDDDSCTIIRLDSDLLLPLTALTASDSPSLPLFSVTASPYVPPFPHSPFALGSSTTVAQTQRRIARVSALIDAPLESADASPVPQGHLGRHQL